MQTSLELPCDLDTPVSAYLKLAPLGPRFLLESIGGAGRGARYSFLGFGTGREVELRVRELLRGHTEGSVADRRTIVLDALRSALAEAPLLTPSDEDGGDVREEELGPFRGGLVGAASFGLARALAGLPAPRAQTADSIPDYLGFAPRHVLVFDHRSGRLSLLSAGSRDERREVRGQVVEALRAPLPKPVLAPNTGAGRASVVFEPTQDREEFLRSVRRSQEAIQAGDLYQLVLSTRFEAHTDLTPIELYRALRLVDPSPYLFLLEFADSAIVGASPEALLRVEGSSAFVQPIAGTRPRGRDREQDLELEAELLADPKEAAEHVMLVDLARSDLGRVARPGTVALHPFREVKRYRDVMHLASGVQAELEPQFDAFDAFAAAFPAGTVVGAPRTRAMEWIEDLEPESRGFYAGAVGVFGHGYSPEPPTGGAKTTRPRPTANQAIAIRTAVLRNGKISVQAGAGVVRGSVPEREYEEVLAKTRAMGRALASAQGGLQ